MDRQQIMQLASQNPEVQKAVEMAKQQVSHMDLNPQMIDEIVQVLEHVMDNPNDYPAIRAAAIRDGFVDEGDLPADFDPVIIASLLIVFYGLKDQAGQQQAAFARGGLARLAAQGRGGDTMLAHINPQEAEMLRRMGGSGSVNPNTGLREFKGGGLSNVIKTVAPIALAVAAPGLGAAIGASMGLTGAAAALGGSAALGAGLGALGGGGLKGAAIGALGGALGAGGAESLGNTVAGEALGKTGQQLVGGSLAGAGMGALTGQGAKQGALQGLTGTLAGNAISGMAGSDTGALSTGIRNAGQTTGGLLTMGADPRTALIGGALTGLASGVQNAYNTKPSSSVVNKLGDVNSMSGPDFEKYATRPDVNTMSGPEFEKYATSSDTQPAAAGATTKAPVDTGDTGLGFNKNTLIGGLTIAGLSGGLSQAPAEAQKAVSSMSPEQQAYFNRPTLVWDWDKMMSDAKAQNQDLGTYMATNWNNISGGAYNKNTGNTVKSEVAPAYARGGALSMLAQGGGSGRADTIHAKLSDGEYVMDAETVALLGDGSTKEGARRLDEMRKKLRMQKGKTLAKGGFSPAAKSPLAYMKGAA